MCNLTIAAEDTKIGMPVVRPLGAGMTVAEWCHLIGPKKTKELYFNIGKLIDGKKAERISLVNRAVPAGKLEEDANEEARQIAERGLKEASQAWKQEIP